MDRRQTYEMVKAATVAICFLHPDGRLIPFGSGVNVHPSGIVVTCKHVIEGAQVLSDSEGNNPALPRTKEGVATGTVIMRDIVAVFSLFRNRALEIGIGRFDIIHGPHDSDLAVGRLRQDASLPALRIGNSDDVFEGQAIFTCGFPLGPDLQIDEPVGALFHRGIISGIRPHYLAQKRDRFLLDISVNPGNSGGPLCSEDTGEVVGIIDALVQDEGLPTGIGCAVPGNLARPYVEQVMRLGDSHLEDMRHGIWPTDK